MTEFFAQPDDLGELRASELQTSWGEFLGAHAGEGFMSGVRNYIQRPIQWGMAEGSSTEGLANTDPLGNSVSSDNRQGVSDRTGEIPDVAIDDAKARVKQAGLDGQMKLPEQATIKQPVLDLMIQHARERRDTEAAIARGPQGFLPGALGFATEIAAGIIDPVNIAAFSIPVLGEARFGKMMLAAGDSLAARAGVRAVAGGLQGAVGTAALQPADWWLHTKDGQDYTMAEALRSIVLGAGMGAVFHAGGGAFKDYGARRAGLPLPGSPEDLVLRGLGAGKAKEGPIPGADAGAGQAEITNPALAGEDVPGVSSAARGGKPEIRPEELSLEDFKAAAGRGKVGPAEEPGFARIPRAPVEHRGGEDSLLRQADLGMNLGYHVDDVARYTAHTTAMKNDADYRAAVMDARGTGEQPAIPPEHVEAAHALLQGEAKLHGPAKPATAATLKEVDQAKQPSGLQVLDEDGHWVDTPELPPEHPARILADLPPQAREDVTRAAIADIISGNQVRAGEMLHEAAKEDPRIAESLAAQRGASGEPVTRRPNMLGEFMAQRDAEIAMRGRGGRADWKALADAARPDDADLAAASREADTAPEIASTDPQKTVSAAEAAAKDADALLADILPRLSDEERQQFEDVLAKLDQDREAQEQIVRDGAECLMAAGL